MNIEGLVKLSKEKLEVTETAQPEYMNPITAEYIAKYYKSVLPNAWEVKKISD